MTYAVSNSPRKIAGGIGASGNSFWLYVDGDAHGTVSGTDYFTNGRDLGMKVGDIVHVVNTSGYTVTTHAVSAIDADGNATVSAAVLS